MNTRQIEKNIERDIKARWGWVVSVTVSRNGEVKWEGHRERNRDRYDMYPGMTQEQADAKVMDEILQIIRKYIPGFVYTSYEQSGVMHNFQAG